MSSRLLWAGVSPRHKKLLLLLSHANVLLSPFVLFPDSILVLTFFDEDAAEQQKELFEQHDRKDAKDNVGKENKTFEVVVDDNL